MVRTEVFANASSQHSDSLYSPTGWGHWKLDAPNRTLVFARGLYVVDVSELHNSARILDALAQVRAKTWGSVETTGSLLAALDDILGLQQRLCGLGHDRRLDRRVIVARIKEFAAEHPDVLTPRPWQKRQEA